MKILKFTTFFFTTATVLLASANIDSKVISFEKQMFITQKNLVLTKVDIIKKEKLPFGDWYGYILDLQANVPGSGVVTGRNTIFSNGDAIAPELINMKTGESFKNILTLKATSVYYKKDHLIAGNADAKNKVILFSDPLCPYCITAFPSIIQKVKNNPTKIALYYYDFPLVSLHPASKTITKIMVLAQKKGVKDVVAKIYEASVGQYFPAGEKDEQKILNSLNKILKTKITLKELEDKSLSKKIQSDMQMGSAIMVRGTPTLFVNGTMDRTRTLFQGL